MVILIVPSNICFFVVLFGIYFLFEPKIKLISTINLLCRISGNAASDKNIHGTVAEQLKKTFAKSRWRVRTLYHYNM